MESGEIKNANGVQFKQFDVVSDPSDHHYAHSMESGGKNKDTFTNENSSLHKKIMREWKILEKDLPDSIYVRAYEGRIDLLRAVIVGARGTPYHDGLFFFDIAFPSNYPQQPPKVHYHSYGLRLNPNLYAGGYVCLSLINTWNGQKKERWDHSSSTILQVLVSIQGLVLNERPYFNEPYFSTAKNDQTKYWVEKSLEYNEDVFALNCKTMLYVSRNPPKNFEGFVAQHFGGRAHDILASIMAYRDGHAIVGCYKKDGSSSSSKVSVSAIFKDNMGKIYCELSGAFSSFVPQIAKLKKAEKARVEILERLANDIKPQSVVEKQPRQGILQKFVGVLKWLSE